MPTSHPRPHDNHRPDEIARQAAAWVESAPLAAFACDATGAIVAFNQGAVTIWGRTPRCGEPGDGLIAAMRPTTARDDGVESGACTLVTALRGARPIVGEEWAIERPDGSRRLVVVHAKQLFDREGRVGGAVASLHDVTDRRAAEETLRTTAQRAEATLRSAREIFEHDPHCVKIVDVEGFLIDMNPAGIAAIEARSLADVLGASTVGIVAPEYRRAYLASLNEAAANGQSHAEFEIIGFRGTRRRMEHKAVRLLGQSSVHGGPVIMAVARDITAQREAEAENRMLAEAVRRCPNGAIVTDAHGRVMWANEGFERMSGYVLAEIRGRKPREFLHGPETDSAESARVGTAVRQGQGCVADLVNYAKDGRRYIVRVEIEPLRGADGHVTGFMAIESDITVEVEREAALREARHNAEAASQSKSEFLANMSHEIRTPMTAILGYAELLVERGDRAPSAAERTSHIETIRRNGEHLLAIINDILDVSKIEAGKMTVEAVGVRVETVVGDVIALLAESAATKGIELSSSFATSFPETITTDPIRLRQILVNLVGNAIKFTPAGSVRVTVLHEPEGAGRLRFDVVDTGIGIESGRLACLFQAFVQADSSTTRRFGGTGLGLRISKRLACMLGGDITVVSEPGRGSTFSLTVATGPIGATAMIEPTAARSGQPEACGAPRGPTATAEEERPLQGVRILLAEDGPDNQRLISHHLRRAGAEVHTVENGRLAVEAMTSDGSVDGNLLVPPPFDLILTDMQMPEMDGYASTRLLRSKGCRLPIVALTAHAMSGDAARCREAGCSDYATKPIDRQGLLAACAEAIRRSARRPRLAA